MTMLPAYSEAEKAIDFGIAIVRGDYANVCRPSPIVGRHMRVNDDWDQVEFDSFHIAFHDAPGRRARCILSRPTCSM
jgi:hypothetical protein